MDEQDQAYTRRHAAAYISLHYGPEAGESYAAWYGDRFIGDAATLADLPAHGSVWADWYEQVWLPEVEGASA